MPGQHPNQALAGEAAALKPNGAAEAPEPGAARGCPPPICLHGQSPVALQASCASSDVSKVSESGSDEEEHDMKGPDIDD